MTTPDPAAPGARYGLRVIIGDAEPLPRGERRVSVRCDCGNFAIVPLCDLRRGRGHACRSCAIFAAHERKRVTEARDGGGSRCGYRPQCPPDGHESCRYYLPKHDLCALTCADLGPQTQAVVGELMGIAHQSVNLTEQRAANKRHGLFRRLWLIGFERGWRDTGTRQVHRRAT